MPGINYTIGLNNSAFFAGVGGALQALEAIKGAFSSLVGAFQTVTGAAANIETLRTAFIPLLGSVDAAKARMAELSDFANSTPFELPEVAAASRTLETLTKGALSTGKGLTLVGDLASATNRPFEEIAVTVGRLYDGLQSGRPIGEAMMRLQELGAIGGDTRTQLEDLQKTGAKGDSVWNIASDALQRYSGGMELQSQTWNGKLSTLNDSIRTLWENLGTPLIDGLKPALDELISTIDNLRPAAKAFGETLKEGINSAITGTKLLANIASDPLQALSDPQGFFDKFVAGLAVDAGVSGLNNLLAAGKTPAASAAPSPGDTVTNPLKIGTGTLAVDRLAQMGGYVGSLANAGDSPAQREVAAYTKRTADNLDTLVARNTSGSGCF